MISTRRAFTLVEVLMAIAVMAVTLLTLVSVCALGLRADKKSLTSLAAVQLGERQLDRWLSRARDDDPAGSKADLWDRNCPYPSPWKQGRETIGGVDFDYALYTSEVPLGQITPNNRMKRVDVVVTWMGGDRSGSGQMQEFGYRLVNEADD